MLTALVQGVVPNTRNVWFPWLNHLTKDGDKTGIRDAALVTKRGTVSCHTPHFQPSAREIQNLNDLFLKKNKDKDKFCLGGSTYLISSLSDKHMTALNGRKVLIACPSETMYIVVRSDCLQDKLTETVAWIEHLCAKLSSRNY